MSLATNLQNAFVRVATEFKTIRTLVTGSAAGDLSTLETTDKSSIIAAINEAASAGGASNLSGLTDVTITGAATGHIVRHNGTEFVNVAGTTFFQPASGELDVLAGQTSTAYGRGFSTLVNQSGLMALIRAASEAVTGIAQFATNAQSITGTSTSLMVHPAGLAAAIADKVDTGDLSSVAFSGDAGDLTGTLPNSVLPPLAVGETFVVANQAAMLALTAQRGDVAKRTDLDGDTFILSSDDPTTLADWVALSGTVDVSSVAGKTGAVTLVKADVGLANVDNTSDANKPVSTAQASAIGGKQTQHANLTEFSTLSLGTEDMVPYVDAAGSLAMTGLTDFIRTLLDDANQDAALTTLGAAKAADVGDTTTNFQTTFENALVP